MDVKNILKALTLELRHELEGKYDAQGTWQPGDLERRLASIGVWRDREPKRVDELPRLSAEDREARRVVDTFVESRTGAGQRRDAAIAEFVRDAAYTWTNRLLALRCMEARSLIDEIILQKDSYGGRSLQHNRLAKKQPERCAGEDEGLLAVLFDEFGRRAEELPLLFDPHAPEVALRPSVAALKRSIGLLSGSVAVKGQEAVTDDVFTAPDALGWTYQYWNAEEKDRVDASLKSKKGFKCEGVDIIYKTGLYTEPYIVRFLVQNTLGAIWMGMHPASRLLDNWAYYIRDTGQSAVPRKPVAQITFLDPACGSGHFLIEAFDLFYGMYLEEGTLTEPLEICASILERNLFGIDIDERAVQMAALALVMKAKEKAPEFVPRRVNLVATNIRLPGGKEHLDAFLRKHPDDAPLKPALVAIFEALEHADELGSLLQIEEPVERELRHLREQQIARERKAGAGTLFGPRDQAEWLAWKTDLIGRLRDHFGTEARETDLMASFFGEAASKGLSLVDALSRRYDIVCANPPYLGAKKYGATLKSFLKTHYRESWKDLFSAFIARAASLLSDSGLAGLVTQQTLLSLDSYGAIRRRLVESTQVTAIAQLGEHAFSDPSAAGAFAAMSVFRASEPRPEHAITFLDVAHVQSPDDKASALRRQAVSVQSEGRLAVAQSLFLRVPETNLGLYALPSSLLEAFLTAPDTIGSLFAVTKGLKTGQDRRFVRYWWEGRTPSRWVPYHKGGGYTRWHGNELWVVDWEHNGVRLKERVRETVPPDKFTLLVRDERYYGAPSLTYSSLGRGAFAVRPVPGGIASDGGQCLVPKKDVDAAYYTTVLSSRPVSLILRGLTGGRISVDKNYVIPVPLPPRGDTAAFREVTSNCHTLKKALSSRSLTEPSFAPPSRERQQTLVETYVSVADEIERIAALLHSIEGAAERMVFALFGTSTQDQDTIVGATGAPAAWNPVLAGYDVPPRPASVELTPRVLELVEIGASARPDERAAGDEIGRLKAMYESGQLGAETLVDEVDECGDVDEDEEGDGSSVQSPGARLPIPAQTLLEDLAIRLRLHPISVYGLLREMREREKVVCRPELLRSVEDWFSVLVLRILGHQWPRQVEAREPSPSWVDKDGIIPLTGGTEDPALVTRVRARLAEDFGSERVGALEREFEEITGRSLTAWLSSDFFKRHISQFKKRPIAWHITSASGVTTKRRGRGAAQHAPAFSCLVCFHRLDGDLIPKMRTQYVGPLRTGLQTELASLEKIKDRSPDQEGRRLELEAKIEELKAFDARLEQLIVAGFATPVLDKLAAKAQLDKWTSRDGRARAPEKSDAFLAQEGRYDPDLNDGVRVNIAPLQRAGLLAAEVLAGKDVEKAIADRAEWRADERRWCREGKLPQPGWWPRKEGGR